MDVAGLKIQITADVNDAVSKMQSVDQQLAKTTSATETSGLAFQQFGKTLTTTATTGSASIFQLTEKLRALKDAQFTETDINKVRQYGAAIAATQREMNQLAMAGQEGAANVGKMGAAIARYTDLNVIGAREITNFSRRIFSLLPALAFSGIGAGISLLAEWVMSLKNGGEAAAETAKKTEELKKATAGFYEEAGKETGTVAGLVAVLKSETETRVRKNEALEQLKKINPEIFGQLTLEHNAVLGLDTAYQNYLAHFKDVIAAKILQAQIEQKTTELLKLQGATQGNLAKSLYDDFKKNAQAMAANGAPAALDAITKSATNTQTGVNRLNFELQGLLNRLTEVSKGVELDPVKTKKEHVDKSEDPFKIELADLEDNLRDELAQDGYYKELQLKIELDYLEKKKLLLEKYGKYEGENNLAITKKAEEIFKEHIKFMNSQYIPDINTRELTGGALIGKSADAIKLQKDSDAIAEQQRKIREQLAETADMVNATLTPAFDAFFENLGKGGQSAFSAFISALGQVIIELEKSIVKAFIFAGIKSLITGVPIDFGEVFQSAIPHAEGGIFTGPTLLGNHLFGEAGPEAIVPLNRMNEFNGGGKTQQVFIPNVTLKGQDLVISFNRTTGRIGRNG